MKYYEHHMHTFIKTENLGHNQVWFNSGQTTKQENTYDIIDGHRTLNR